MPVTIVMPASTPTIKVSQTESHGAEVILHGEMYDEAYAEARRLSEERGLTFVHPFDDLEVMAGQGTVALEMLADAPDLDAARRADRRRRADLRHGERRQGLEARTSR